MNLNIVACRSALTGAREVTLYDKLERVLPPRFAGCALIISVPSCREPPIDTNLRPSHPVSLETDQIYDNHDRFDPNLDYQPRRQHHLPELTRGRRLPPHGLRLARIGVHRDILPPRPLWFGGFFVSYGRC